MTIAMQPIYTQTVGAGGASVVTFNNIPQTFTDLTMVAAGRAAGAVVSVDWIISGISGDAGNNYSVTQIYGTGSGQASQRQSNIGYMLAGFVPGASATANTFGSASFYFPNYTSSTFKSVIADSVTENNGTTGWQAMMAGLWRGTGPITSLTISTAGGGSLVQHSTFTLYGITKG